MKALKPVTHKGDATAIAAVARLFEDADVNVRFAALDTFSEISEEGDADAIEAVAGRLEDASALVRGGAVRAYAKIAGKDTSE